MRQYRIPEHSNVHNVQAAWTESSSFILRRAIVRVADGQSADALQRKSTGTADERRKQIVSATADDLAEGSGNIDSLSETRSHSRVYARAVCDIVRLRLAALTAFAECVQRVARTLSVATELSL